MVDCNKIENNRSWRIGLMKCWNNEIYNEEWLMVS